MRARVYIKLPGLGVYVNNRFGSSVQKKCEMSVKRKKILDGILNAVISFKKGLHTLLWRRSSAQQIPSLLHV